MDVNRMTLTIFAALLATGLATGAIAQTGAPAAQSPKPGPTTPAPPAAGSVGMDKGAGTGAAASPSKESAKSSLSRSERRFVEKAMQGGLEEVEKSKLAVDKAQNARVKELAKRLVDDHSKANAELAKLASAKGVTPPAAIDAGHQRRMERMAKKTGAEFDREYMGDMINDHQKAVRDHQSMARSAKDADVRKYAATIVPTLEQHLQMVKAADAALKSASKKAVKSAAAPK
jgi:putative membrane protein